MTELVFERGLFATLAAALIVPELTTFLLFLFVLLNVGAFAARQTLSCVWLSNSHDLVRQPRECVPLRVVSEDSSSSN